MSSKVYTANRLRNTLETSKRASLGAWQMLPGTHLSRTLARSGYDWVLIDCEHGNIADNEMHESVQAIASCNVSPIVRIADNQSWMVKRALDAGAHGILVPLLYSVDDAKRLVSFARFPPKGRRGFGSPFPMTAFDVPNDLINGQTSGLTEEEYLEAANDSLVTIVQIETREALECVEDIADVDGVDVLFVGPFDLGNNIGHPIKGDKVSPELDAAIDRVLKATRDAGKTAGIYSPDAKIANTYLARGFGMIHVLTDVAGISEIFAESLKVAQGT